MINRTIYILALAFFISCNSDKNPERKVTIGLSEKAEQKSRSGKSQAVSTTSNKAYENEYIYNDSINKFSQYLLLTWKSKDSIEFKLTSINGICDYEFEGIAVNRSPGMDSEIDEDEGGIAYSSIQYKVIDGGELTGLRIELDKANRARIVYNYPEPRDECDPESNAIMKKVTHTNN